VQNVPRCVLQLVAVGCVFLATKQLEVRCAHLLTSIEGMNQQQHSLGHSKLVAAASAAYCFSCKQMVPE
jgi:hypothetical protein